MIRSKYEIACTRCKPRSTRLGLSRIDCSTYAQENHSRRSGANYCFSQAKCGAMNHKLISTADQRAKVNNGGKNFHRFTFHRISSENSERTFVFLSSKNSRRNSNVGLRIQVKSNLPRICRFFFLFIYLFLIATIRAHQYSGAIGDFDHHSRLAALKTSSSIPDSKSHRPRNVVGVSP